MSIAALLTTLIAIGAPSDTIADTASVRTTKVTHCVVKVIEEVNVPAREPGTLLAIEVREGQAVKKGAAVAKLEDTDALAKLKIAKAEYRVAQVQASSEIRVRAAQAAAEVAETEFLRGENILPSDNKKSEERRLKRLLLAPRQAHLKTDVARLDHEIAKLNEAVRAAQLQTAQNQVNRRRVLSPMDGQIVQVYRHVGDWVNPGDPIIHLVRMDRLRVDGLISAAEFAPEEVMGKPVEIIVRLTRGRTARLKSKISFASPIVEANGRYRISAEINNPRQGEFWQLRPGLTAEMMISLQ